MEIFRRLQLKRQDNNGEHVTQPRDDQSANQDNAVGKAKQTHHVARIFLQVSRSHFVRSKKFVFCCEKTYYEEIRRRFEILNPTV